MSKILITGGAGFIGSHLVDRLIALRRGSGSSKVVIVDDLSTGKKEYLNEKAKFYEADICDGGKIKEIFESEKPEIVFHLAAQMDVRKSVTDPEFDKKVNVGGSLNIFKNCAKAGVKKVVFFSSAGLYGDVDGPANEDVSPRPDSPYTEHKFEAEKLLEKLHNSSAGSGSPLRSEGLNYVILRPANIYGPRQYKGGEGAVVAVFTYNALNNKESVVYGDGKQTRDFVYVDDMVEAAVLAMKSDEVGTFNIGTGREVSVLDLTKIVGEAVGKEFKFRHEEEREGEVRRSVLAAGRAREELGWSPRVGLEEGIKLTIEWVKKSSI